MASKGLAVKSRLAPGKASHGYSVWLCCPAASFLTAFCFSGTACPCSLCTAIFLPLKISSLPATCHLLHWCVCGSCLSGPRTVYREHRPSWQVDGSTQNQHYCQRACSLFWASKLESNCDSTLKQFKSVSQCSLQKRPMRRSPGAIYLWDDTFAEQRWFLRSWATSLQDVYLPHGALIN